MTVRLNDLLEHVLEGEPELGDQVDAVFRQATRLRRRRRRALIAGAAAVVAGIAAAGYGLTTTLLPGPAAAPRPAATATAPSPSVSSAGPPADPVLGMLAPIVGKKDLRIVAGSPDRGDGWRRYSVTDDQGRSRGTVEVAVYHVADDLCFPVLASKKSCARTEWAPKGVEYVRYDDESDQDRQVHQTIARRISDGRTLAVMAAGKRDTGDAGRGKPALSGKQVERVATGPELFDAFGPDETCTGAAADDCPAFEVPVPTED
jgi:hypothetical protein